MSDVFLTGATGFLGRHIARRLLLRADEPTVYCLVRADDDEAAAARLRRSIGRVASLKELEDWAGRFQALRGDLTEVDLGLSPEQLAAIRERCTQVIHSAADVRFNQPIEEARSRNLGGTQNVAALASSLRDLRRFDWVGTTFVAGRREDRVLESDLEHEAGFRNSYEQSKYEAEQWLRSKADELKLTVFRPSIIVGDSATGKTSNYGVLYWPVQVYAKGYWRTVVGRPDTPIDLVPVDFVADALCALSGPGQPVGGTYQLAAGPEGSLRIDEIAEMLRSYFDGPRVRYVDPDFFMRWVRPGLDLFLWGKRGRVLKAGGQFFVPYFSGNPLFDVTETRAALEPLGIRPPEVRTYMTTLLSWCTATDFGRRAESCQKTLY